MRAVIRKAQGQQQQMRPSSQGDMYCAAVTGGSSVPYLSHIPNYGNNLTNGSSFSGGDFSNLASRMCHKPADVSDLSSTFSKNVNQSSENNNYNAPNPVLQSSDNTNSNLNPHNVDQLAVPSNISPAIHTDAFGGNVDKNPTGSKNPLLGTLLSQGGNSNAQLQYQQSKHANTMLMSMLSDVPSANPSSSSFPFLGKNVNTDNSGKVRKQRKRKATSDSRSPGSTGRSPKRKLSEDECVRDQPTPDAESTGSPTMAFEMSSSLPASLPSSSGDPLHLGQAMTSSEVPFIKSEPSHGYPQRSASTDSYLMHENFQSQQILNINDSSRLSEGGTPSNSELFCTISQAKKQYFNADNVIEFSQGTHSNLESNFSETVADASDIDIDDESPYSVDSNQTSSSSRKMSSTEKPSKKSKKTKDNIDCKMEHKDLITVKVHDFNSSEESSLDDFSMKSCSETENSQTEDQAAASKSNPVLTSQPIIISTSLKIAKSGDSHKISKSEIKAKQKEGRRSTSTGDGAEGSSGKRRGEGKKERKRRRAESADSISGRSPVRPFHVSIDSSLMPPPASSSESAPIVSTSDSQPIRPITLNVKASSSVSSSSPLRSKSPGPSKKISSGSSSTINSPSKSNLSLKSGSDRLVVKPSPPRSSHFVTTKVVNAEPDGSSSNVTKVAIPTSLKLQSKHKQSSSSKNNSSILSISQTSGRSSPSKTKSATLKLKNLSILNLPSSTTITPIITKATSASSTSSHASLPPVSSSISIIPASGPASPPGKQGSNSSKANKAALRSRKGSLSAVIDKLRVTATNAQHVSPIGAENLKSDCGGTRMESSMERRESKLERKESSKESKDGSATKSSESKAKYFSSDQFTVKQSSQGIKLTVTKTRSSDGSSKSGKSKNLSMKSSVSSSGTGNSGKASSSSGNTVSKSGSTMTASKKAAFQTISGTTHQVSVSPKTSTSASNPTKSATSTSQKLISPSSTPTTSLPRISSSTSSTKSSSKQVSSSQNKMSVSSTKTLEKSEKKSSSDLKPTSSGDAKEKVVNSTINMVTSLMPPPPSSKLMGDAGRTSSSGSTPKRNEEAQVRHSPRHTPTRDIVDESEGERAFRLLLAQTKVEGQNGAEQTVPTTKSSELTVQLVDCGKPESVIKIEPEDKGHWVSSSTDVKSSVHRSANVKINQAMFNACDIDHHNESGDVKQIAQRKVKVSQAVFYPADSGHHSDPGDVKPIQQRKVKVSQAVFYPTDGDHLSDSGDVKPIPQRKVKVSQSVFYPADSDHHSDSGDVKQIPQRKVKISQATFIPADSDHRSESGDAKQISQRKVKVSQAIFAPSETDHHSESVNVHQITQAEVSSSSKHDNVVSANLVSSTEEINKNANPFTKPTKQTKRLNAHSEDDSSPDNNLIIDPDCLGQKSPDKKWSSPRVESNVTVNATDEKGEKPESSPGTFPIKSPYQRSPLKSPAQVKTPPSNHSLSSSLPRPSPCIIDDELMDEALMTIGK